MANKKYPSFFNEVMAPVMLAGSSSHLAAPQRIGLLTNMLANGDVKKVEVIMDKDGSFAGTFGLMSEDEGMCAGGIGLAVDSPLRNKCFDIAKERGIEVVFTKGEMKESSHINAMKFIITTSEGKQVSVVGDSIGGGVIETQKVNNFDFVYRADTCVTMVVSSIEFEELVEVVEKKIQGLYQTSVSRNVDKVAYFFRSTELPNRDELAALLPDCEVFVLDLVMDSPFNPKVKPQLFSTSKEFIELSKDKPMHEVAIEYQMAATGMSREAIINRIDYLRTLMVNQVESQENWDGSEYKHVYDYDIQSYKRVNDQLAKGGLGDSPQALALKYYYGVFSMTPQVPNVAFPHGAGGGVVMATLRAAQVFHNHSDEEVNNALLVAASYGIMAYTHTDPSGETIGCAGEHGLSGAFGSAALTYLRGGTPKQVDSAASLALQLSVGWPCDPMMGDATGGPCTPRGIAAATMPFMYSELSLAGQTTILPFDEVVEAAERVASNYGEELLCTGRGGCAACPSACDVKRDLGL
ncbi:L-serine dehydratase [Vibrio sp. JCM 19236]|nr:L-serine dehydratase [Vibrio sp. JCM 19236]